MSAVIFAFAGLVEGSCMTASASSGKPAERSAGTPARRQTAALAVPLRNTAFTVGCRRKKPATSFGTMRRMALSRLPVRSQAPIVPKAQHGGARACRSARQSRSKGAHDRSPPSAARTGFSGARSSGRAQATGRLACCPRPAREAQNRQPAQSHEEASCRIQVRLHLT